MTRDRLNLLYLSQFPPGPPRYGAQRRIQGLMRALSRNHDITSVALITPDLDPAEAQRAGGEYCREVVLVPSRRWEGLAKRLLQARSLLSTAATSGASIACRRSSALSILCSRGAATTSSTSRRPMSRAVSCAPASCRDRIHSAALAKTHGSVAQLAEQWTLNP